MEMAISSSGVTVIPKNFSGLRVLLIEHQEASLQYHAFILTQNSYQVMASDDIHLRITKEILEKEAVMCLLKPCSLTDICNIWKHICRKRIAFQQNVSKQGILHIEEDQVKPSPIIDGTMSTTTIEAGVHINNSQDEYAAGVVCKKVTYDDLFSDDDDDEEHVDEISTPPIKGNAGTGLNIADKGKQALVLKRKNEEDDEYYKKREENKTRIRWKGALHDRFLKALDALGEQAHSSSIVKHMNVPGLTRYQVASHLQKYKLKQKSIKPSIRRHGFQVESYKSNRRRFVYSSNGSDNHSTNIIQDSTRSSSSSVPMLNSVGNSYMTIDNIEAKLQGAGVVVLPHELISTTSTSPIINNNSSNIYGSDQLTTDYSLGYFNSSGGGGEEHVIQMMMMGHANYAMEPQQQLTCGEISTLHDDANFQELGLMAPCAGSSSSSSATVTTSEYYSSVQGMVDGCNSWGGAASSEAAAAAALDCVGIGNGTAPNWVATVSDGPEEDLGLPHFLSGDLGGGLFSYQDFHGKNMNQVFSRSMTLSGHVELPPINSSVSEIDSGPYGVLANMDFSLLNFSAEENNTTTVAHEIQPPNAYGTNSSSSNIINVVPSDDGSSECMITVDDLLMNMSQSDLEMTMDYLGDAAAGYVID